MSEEDSPLDELIEPRESKVGVIFLTLFMLALVAALVVMGFMGKDHQFGQWLSQGDLYATTLGNLHPLTLHLPIGVVFLVILMEFLGWLSFGKYRPVTGVILFLGIIMGAIACVTGFAEMYEEGLTESSEMERHMWLGIGFVGVLVLAFLARVWSPEKGGRNPIYAILLLGAGTVMCMGAHIAGISAHGPTGVEKMVNQLRGQEVAEIEERVIKKEPKDRLAYAEVVVPILESKCLECHSVDTKDKGDLLMDSWEALLKGGAEGPALVPGDTEESLMIYRIHLPIDDEDEEHMPPPKKDQLEQHEKDILDWWVAALPEGVEILEDKTLEEMGAPAEILEAVGKFVPAEKPTASEPEMEAVEPEVIEPEEVSTSAFDQLKQDEEFENAIAYVIPGSTEIEFTAASLRDTMTDEHLAKLAPLAESITSLQLSTTAVTEGAVVEALKKMPNLKKLNLSQTEFTDAGLDAVAQLKSLEWLNLYGTMMTDEGILKLGNLKSLKKIYLWNSGVTPAGKEALKALLPEAEITLGIDD